MRGRNAAHKSSDSIARDSASVLLPSPLVNDKGTFASVTRAAHFFETLTPTIFFSVCRHWAINTDGGAITTRIRSPTSPPNP